jgi:ATP-dependent Lhr-like helicase
MDTILEEREIASSLQHTWSPFFQRFGRLREVQIKAIPPLLEGRDAVICSPTSSGKTEAACAPIIERSMGKRNWQILYICPTRALVNDLFLRLEGPLKSLGLTIERRTGDHQADYWKRPNVLITTPESFDSMLCRGNDVKGHALDGVKAIILDEIHLLHGTARGEQVKWLIWRLKRILMQDHPGSTGKQVQVVALSATISDPESIICNYLDSDAVTINAGGHRIIETVEASSSDKDITSMLEAHLEGATPSKKILVFCNSRAEVDRYTSHFSNFCKGTGYEVRAHHGSLTQGPREETEERARMCGAVIVFSTSSLEIGIDIGDIDLVVLNRPPPDVLAFLQRIGRGNRRSERTRVMLCHETEREGTINQAMLKAARDGWMPSSKVGDCYSVIRQQIASYIFQSLEKRRGTAKIEDLFRSRQANLHIHELVLMMIGSDEIKKDGQNICLGDDWIEKSVSMGKIHSNIEGRMGMSIVDHETGKALVQGVRSTSGDGFSLNHMNYEKVGQDQRSIQVRKNSSIVPDGGIKYSTSSNRMKDTTHPMIVRHYLDLTQDDWKIVRTPQCQYVFHLGGPSMELFLQMAMVKNNIRCNATIAEINEWYIAFLGEAAKPTIGSSAARDMRALMNESDMGMAERILGRPSKNSEMPKELRLDELMSWTDPSKEHAAFLNSKWSPCEDKREAAILRVVGGI